MKKGIVLIALGHPYYGRMAYNLALTLRAVDSDINITLIHNNTSITHLDDIKMSIFNSIIEITDSKYWTVNDQTNFAFVKLFIHELSPYDETLLLDVDMAWCSMITPTQAIDSLKSEKLLIKNRNYIDFETGMSSDGKEFFTWAPTADIKNAYKIKSGRLYGLHLEFVYFKKSKANEKIFNDAIKIATNSKVNSTLLWAGQNNADELPMTISMCLNKVIMVPSYNPAHWGDNDGFFLKRNEIMSNYLLLSTGGKSYDKNLKSFYNDLVQAASYKLNMPNGYAHADKKNYLPERKNV